VRTSTNFTWPDINNVLETTNSERDRAANSPELVDSLRLEISKLQFQLGYLTDIFRVQRDDLFKLRSAYRHLQDTNVRQARIIDKMGLEHPLEEGSQFDSGPLELDDLDFGDSYR
jgi:hypothetical protein